MPIKKLTLSFIAWLALYQPAYAIFNINTADIVAGKLIVESRNRVDNDSRANKDGLQANALRLSYGINSYHTLEMQSLWQANPGHNLAYTTTEFETKFRFYKPGDYWLDSAFKLGYEKHSDDGHADQIKTKAIIQKSIGNWTNLININLSKEIGPDTRKDVGMTVGWRTKYTINRYIEPGFEYYADFGELTDMPDYSGQAHRIGPMFFGELLPNMKYQVGYLFGTSKAAEDGSFKLFLRYEFLL